MATAAISHRLGPGQLVMGETGSEKQWGDHVTQVTLSPDYDEGDAIHVLSGQTIPGEVTTTWKLSGEILQEYTKDSLLFWCHQNSGEEVKFTFRPSSDNALQAEGKLVVRAVSIGGEVKKRGTSEFEFTVVGDPELKSADAVEEV